MAQKLKFGNGVWANKEGSTLAYNDENGNYKPLPFNFTRSSSATRVNKQGLIEVVKNNKPRIDYLDSAKGALILEPSRSNVITDSEDISTWTNSGSLTRTYNIAVAPNGQTTADGIQDETGGTFKYVYKQVSVSANSTYSGSIFVKKVASETNYMGILFLFSGGTTKVAYGIINSVTGTIVSADSTITPTFKVDDYGNYWRFSITATDNGSNTLCRFGVYACLSTNGTTLSTGVSSIRTIWGAQLEDGSYPTSYIPTQGSAVTRVADNISLTLPDTSSFNSSNGFSVITKFDIGEAGIGTSSPFLFFNDDTSNTFIGFGSNITRFRCRLNLNGTAYLNTQDNALRTQRNSLFISCDASGWSQGANGVTNFTGTNDASVFNKLANITCSSSDVYGIIKIREILVYNTRLTDQELQALTTL